MSAVRRWIVVTLLGFASGLPLALSGQALQAWLSMDGVDVATIGFLSLAGVPYTLKFLWAPLMDRMDLPWLGRRRGWIVLTQAALAGLLWMLASTDPLTSLPAFASLALAVAFSSASQDVVIDAYRTDLLPPRERGFGSSLTVMGYRLAMILSGGVALIWTDPSQGDAMSWREVYRIMATIMAGAAVLSAITLPPVPSPPVDPRRTELRCDLLGFLAVLAVVAAGAGLTRSFGRHIAGLVLSPWAGQSPASGSIVERCVELVALLGGMALTIPFAIATARVARFDSLRSGLVQFFGRPHAMGFLLFITLYKVTDAFAMSILTPFLLQGMTFAPAEVGLANKVLGMLITVLGSLLGGLLMLWLQLARSLLLFGVLQMASVSGFWWLALHGKGALPAVMVPRFDLGFVRLVHDTPIDGGLLLAVASEHLASGMGTAAFIAFLMSLTDQRYTGTQFALLSALAAVGGVWVSPVAGVLAQAIGWPHFFLVAMATAVPPLLLLAWLWRPIEAVGSKHQAKLALIHKTDQVT